MRDRLAVFCANCLCHVVDWIVWQTAYHDPRAFRYIYPVAGVLGLCSASLYFRIRQRRTLVAQRLTRASYHAGHAPRAALLASASDWMGDVQRALRNPLRGSSALFYDMSN